MAFSNIFRCGLRQQDNHIAGTGGHSLTLIGVGRVKCVTAACIMAAVGAWEGYDWAGPGDSCFFI